MRIRILSIVLVCVLSSCVPPADQSVGKQALRVRHPQTTTLAETVRRAIENAIDDWVLIESAGHSQHDRANGYAELGKIYLAHHFYIAAADAFEAALTLTPEQTEWHYYHGVALQRMDKPEAAVVAYSAVLQHQEVIAARIARATALLELGRTVKAANDLAILLTRNFSSDTQEAIVHALAGELALINGEYSAAESHFRTAIERHPDTDVWYRPLALALREQNKFDLAKKALDAAGDNTLVYQDHLMQAVNRLSRSTQDYIDRGQAFMRERNFSAAAREFAKAVDIGPSNAAAHATYGRTLEILGKYDEAREHYSTAIELSPEYSVAHFFFGSFLERQNDAIAARQHYRLALLQKPAYLPPRLLLAQSLFRERQFAEARIQYQSIAELTEQNIQARFYIGLASLALQDCPMAMLAFEDGVELNPNYGPVLEALARTYGVCSADQAKLSRAQSIAEQLLDLTPDASSFHTLAIVHAAQKNFELAIELQTRALARVDENSKTIYLDALARFQSGARATEAWPITDPIYWPPPLTRHTAR